MKHLDIKTVASSSAGNAHIVSDGVTAILLDAGVPVAQLQRATGHGVSKLAAAFITHEHMDHARAARDLVKRGVAVYASTGTLGALGLYATPFAHVFLPLTWVQVGTFNVLPFLVMHDAAEPMGFLLESDATGARVLYLTDSGTAHLGFKRITHLMIECNHTDLDGPVMDGNGFDHTRRVKWTHLGLAEVLAFVARLDEHLQEVHLIHLSDRTADETRIKREVQAVTGAAVFVAQKNGGM